MAPVDTTVTVEDDSVVTIDLADLGIDAGAGLGTDDGKKNGEGDAVVTGKKDGGEVTSKQRTRTPGAADEAAEALTSAMKAQTDSALATAEAERRGRVEAEQRAAARETEAAELRTQNADQQATIFDNEIKRINSEMLSARTDLKHANESGDFDKQAEIQVKLATLGGELAVQNAGKVAHEVAKKTRIAAATTEGRVVPQTPALDRYLSGFAPKAQSWMRAHPECLPTELGGNPMKNASMMQGHYAALSQNVAEGSDDYYRIIEENTGHRQPVSLASEVRKAGATDDDGQGQRQQQQPQRRIQHAAPPTRDSSDGTVQPTAKTLKLTPAMQEVALFSWPAKQGETDADHKKRAFGTYAREYIAAQAEGKIGRSTH